MADGQQSPKQQESDLPRSEKPKMTADAKRPRTSIVYRYAPTTGATRIFFIAVVILLLLAGITALVLYLVYRPSKPRFYVIGAAIYQLGNSNLSSATPVNAISTSMQFTLVMHNPNERASVAYDHLSAYASYRGQPITPPAPLPPLVQDRGATVLVAPVLGGGFVPVAPEVSAGLAADQEYGMVSVRLVVMGRVQYKTGPFSSNWVGMYARCDVLVGVKRDIAGEVPLLGEHQCDIDA